MNLFAIKCKLLCFSEYIKNFFPFCFLVKIRNFICLICKNKLYLIQKVFNLSFSQNNVHKQTICWEIDERDYTVNNILKKTYSISHVALEKNKGWRDRWETKAYLADPNEFRLRPLSDCLEFPDSETMKKQWRLEHSRAK